MKNPERVAELLAELRGLAENDFERHRIGVLERDLTAPPQVEIIDDKHQRFNGGIYHKTATRHYLYASSMHREVWKYHYGEIPKGHEIHHIDRNPENNAITNLQCLTKEEHNKRHKIKPRAFKHQCVCQVCGKIFLSTLSTSKFCSPNCRTRAHNQDSKNHSTKTCPICGKSFATRHKEQICCSHTCASLFMHQNRRDKNKSEVRACKHCGKLIPATESNGGQFCSDSCRWAYRKNNERENRICLECGQFFSCYKHRKNKFCSSTCANRWNAKHKANESNCQKAPEHDR